MPRAFNLIREAPHYRRDAFDAGLRAAGFDVHHSREGDAKKGDVLLIWNRYGARHQLASMLEARGVVVLVAENGFIGRGGTAPKWDLAGGMAPDHYVALARGYHNGGGEWPQGGSERWDALGVQLRPWRTSGEHVLICPNRSFGVPGRMMLPDWAERAAERIRRQTKRPVRIRPHPGNKAPAKPLAADLEGAWAVVIWTSGAGVQALVAGIPVFCEAPYWIAKVAAASGTIDAPEMPDRLPAFRSLAWAQWRLDEVETGEPFSRLLRAAG